MSDSRTFAAELLTAQRTTVDAREPVRGGTGQTPDEVFDDARESLDELEALRARDPDAALAALRDLLDDQTLTHADLDSFIDVWRTAIDKPDLFEAKARQEPVRGPADWWDQLRAYLHRPATPSEADEQVLSALGAMYRLPSSPYAPAVNPHERMLETLDPAWVPLLKAKLGERWWPKGLADMPRHTADDPYVYTACDEAGVPLPKGPTWHVGLVADFGTGYYHSWGIAEQLAAWGFPYTFHLGDVYYAGRPQELRTRFELPLTTVVAKTRLFGLPENHELYSGGASYLEYFAKLRDLKRTPQRGTYFVVRFPEHQIIGADVNWQGRQHYTDPALIRWLQERLDEADGRTNILLTGSAPFDFGADDQRPLLGDLWPFVKDGKIPLWFWGDDHYCALFDRADGVPFYGSCIGHGGYPGAIQPEGPPTYKTRPLWWESEPRFPKWTNLRPDVNNNGWCHAALTPGGGVDLTYVDWMWCKRAHVSFTKDNGTLTRGDVTTFEREQAPVVHEPGGKR